MFKIKRIDYLIGKNNTPIEYEQLLEGQYHDYKSALTMALYTASQILSEDARLRTDDQYGIVDNQLAYKPSGELVKFPLSIVWWDHRINPFTEECDKHVIIGFDIIEA